MSAPSDIIYGWPKFHWRRTLSQSDQPNNLTWLTYIRDGAGSILSCSPTDRVNDVIRDRLSLPWVCLSVSRPRCSYRECSTTALHVIQVVTGYTIRDTYTKTQPFPPIAASYFLGRTRTITCSRSIDSWSTFPHPELFRTPRSRTHKHLVSTIHHAYHTGRTAFGATDHRNDRRWEPGRQHAL